MCFVRPTMTSSSEKMADILVIHTKKKWHSVVCFPSSERIALIGTHFSIEAQCGNECLSLQQVYEWARKLENGTSLVLDLS